ncbi:MAG: hypothetical protein Q4D41_09010 [Prevotellaceae bacterium]|nr:hypothetical protein [Prevotellaceae bacterium]
MKKFTSLFFAALALSTTANAQWNTDKNPVLVSGQVEGLDGPMMVRTDDGKTFFAWSDWTSEGFKLYMQCFDADGNKKFGDSGLLVDDHKSPSWRSDFSLASTSDNCAVVSFADSRSEEGQITSGFSAFQPVFYKVDQDQNFLWGIDGLTFDDILEAPYTEVTRVGDDTYIQWKYRTSSSPVINRVTSDGVVAWSEHKEFGGQILPSVGSDFIAIYMGSDGTMAQRYTKDFEPVWSEPACLSSYTYGGHDLHPYKFDSDGSGGAVVTFVRFMGSTSHMITTQHVSADGELEFGLNSIDVYTPEEGDHDYCDITADKNTGKSLTTWAMKGTDGTYSFKAQQFTSSGDRESGDAGWTIDNKTSASGYAFTNIGCGSLSNGDWIIAYTDDSYWGHYNLYVARYDQSGNQLWKTQIGDLNEYTDATFIVEEECSYVVFSRDDTGIMAARIFNDGTFSKTSGISETKTNENVEVKACYTIDGKQISAPQKGINIVKMSDGTTRKYVMK